VWCQSGFLRDTRLGRIRSLGYMPLMMFRWVEPVM
jgi:hypothetical protein